MVELVRKHKNNGSSGVEITSTPIHEGFKLEYRYFNKVLSDFKLSFEF